MYLNLNYVLQTSRPPQGERGWHCRTAPERSSVAAESQLWVLPKVCEHMPPCMGSTKSLRTHASLLRHRTVLTDTVERPTCHSLRNSPSLGLWDGVASWNSPVLNRRKRLVLPTPTSPTSTTLSGTESVRLLPAVAPSDELSAILSRAANLLLNTKR